MAQYDALPKAYDASSVEDAIYQEWEASGVFNPDNLPERHQAGAPYCIVMPPPNRTGTLHMGHATMLAIEDVLIRFHRMQGKRALWIPGTDHAAIATQVKVEQLLIQQGMKDPRKELGREKFLEKVVAFAEESKNTINRQVRKMGSSCDWSRERYTLDADRNRSVYEMFRMMHEDGIIERGFRIVNWDPQFQTTLSDDEVLTKEVTAKLLTFTYDAEFPIAISTTRPETKFGDTAVAVHPDDERYAVFVGKTFEPVFCGKKLSITIIADEAVDPTFGTGALGVTPAHSLIDADIAVRHSLPTVQVIGQNGCMLAEAGDDFVGLSVNEARKKVESMLKESGVLQKVEEVSQHLPIAERGGAAVEQLPMRQWFVRVNKEFILRQDTFGVLKKGSTSTLKELMKLAIEGGHTTIVPDRFVKTYFHWIDNLRDWCISRQIWFGHRIPVWYRGEEQQVSDVSPGSDWEQDPDTLDTWFSSGMWSFSALGWPNAKQWEEHRDYHPTAVLETGYDILFFWVARMVLMSSYALGEVPFKDVYLHGLVRDEQGRKMSKSLGNILNPLDLIPTYGTDAVRLSLLIGTTPGMDMKLSEEKIAGFRNFTNKLWNISRFILLTIGDASVDTVEAKTLADRWILSRLSEVIQNVSAKLERYELSSAGEELRDFTWNDLADWYLEIAKIEKNKEQILRYILKQILTLWHPFMPFVTESVWGLAGFEGKLIIGSWPKSESSDVLAQSEFDRIRAVITDMRRLRAENSIEPVKLVEYAVVSTEDMRKSVESHMAVIMQMTRAASIVFVSEIADGWATTLSGSVMLGVNIAGAVDLVKEKEKLLKDIEDTKAYSMSLSIKLENQEFLSKAPAKIRETMQRNYDEAQSKVSALQERLAKLG